MRAPFDVAGTVTSRWSRVGGSDLTLRLQAPNKLDGTHPSGTASYLVAEAGTWSLPDGTRRRNVSRSELYSRRETTLTAREGNGGPRSREASRLRRFRA
jgi:hypothetical protein